MKVFGLQVRTLLAHERQSSSQIISKAEFETWVSAHNFLKNTRNKAAQYLKETRKKRQKYYQTIQNRCQSWQHEQELAMNEKTKQSCQDAINETIVWHQNRQELEEALYPKMLHKAMQWICQKIQEIIPEIDLSAALAQSLENYLSGEPAALLGTLRIHADDQKDLAHWGNVFKNLKIEIDENVCKGCAILTTEFFTVHLSIINQIESVLTQIQDFSQKNIQRLALKESMPEMSDFQKESITSSEEIDDVSTSNSQWNESINAHLIKHVDDKKSLKSFRHHRKLAH